MSHWKVTESCFKYPNLKTSTVFLNSVWNEVCEKNISVDTEKSPSLSPEEEEMQEDFQAFKADKLFEQECHHWLA